MGNTYHKNIANKDKSTSNLGYMHFKTAASLKMSDEPYFLNNNEYRTCMLTRLHFKPSEIAMLLDCSLSQVTLLRQRLLPKVFHREGRAKDFDQIIKGIC